MKHKYIRIEYGTQKIEAVTCCFKRDLPSKIESIETIFLKQEEEEFFLIHEGEKGAVH